MIISGLTTVLGNRRILALKRLTSFVLLACIFGLGSGALQFLHELQHAAEDARDDAIAKAEGKPVEEHHHDETNCQVCTSCTWP